MRRSIAGSLRETGASCALVFILPSHNQPTQKLEAVAASWRAEVSQKMNARDGAAIACTKCISTEATRGSGAALLTWRRLLF